MESITLWRASLSPKARSDEEEKKKSRRPSSWLEALEQKVGGWAELDDAEKRNREKPRFVEKAEKESTAPS